MNQQPVTVAVPITQIRCRAWMDHSRSWSIVEEALLLALALGKGGRSVSSMAAASGVPYQVVIASLSRLMRFRLVEIGLEDGAPVFKPSDVGAELALGGRQLPRFPEEALQRFNIGFEHITGSCFDGYEARVVSQGTLDSERRQGADIRILAATEDVGDALSEVNSAQVYKMLERGGDRHFLRLSTRETTVQSRFMLLSVRGSAIRHFPEGASEELRATVLRAALSTHSPSAAKLPAARQASAPRGFRPVRCDLAAADVVVGADTQSSLLGSVVEGAKSRLLIHSTFLDPDRFRAMAEMFRAAVLRGVAVDLLWGAAEPGPAHDRTAEHAREISAMITADEVMRGRVRMRMRTTGSHAKVLLADQEDGGWVAILSSCNWMSTGFQRAELSVVLRHPLVVADVTDLLRRMAGRSPLVDELADELRVQANDLRRQGYDAAAGSSGSATVTLLAGQAHDEKIRVASGKTVKRLVIGSDRLGSTAWSGAIIPGEFARERAGASVTVLYRRPSGELKNRHARQLEREAAGLGIRLIRTDGVQSHGKFVLWDDDDVVVTSLNWASTSGSDQNPISELGVHISCPGLATSVLERLKSILPSMPADV